MYPNNISDDFHFAANTFVPGFASSQIGPVTFRHSPVYMTGTPVDNALPLFPANKPRKSRYMNNVYRYGKRRSRGSSFNARALITPSRKYNQIDKAKMSGLSKHFVKNAAKLFVNEVQKLITYGEYEESSSSDDDSDMEDREDEIITHAAQFQIMKKQEMSNYNLAQTLQSQMSSLFNLLEKLTKQHGLKE